MKRALTIGTAGGKPFTLPLDVVARTQAIVAIRGAGKTVAATVMAEEMCEAGLPWVEQRHRATTHGWARGTGRPGAREDSMMREAVVRGSGETPQP